MQNLFSDYAKEASKGRYEAIHNGTGVLKPDIAEIIKDFRVIKSHGGRAAYAFHWLSNVSVRMSETWTILYEMLAQVRDQELYKCPPDVGVPEWVIKPYPSVAQVCQSASDRPN